MTLWLCVSVCVCVCVCVSYVRSWWWAGSGWLSAWVWAGSWTEASPYTWGPSLTSDGERNIRRSFQSGFNLQTEPLITGQDQSISLHLNLKHFLPSGSLWSRGCRRFSAVSAWLRSADTNRIWWQNLKKKRNIEINQQIHGLFFKTMWSRDDRQNLMYGCMWGSWLVRMSPIIFTGIRSPDIFFLTLRALRWGRKRQRCMMGRTCTCWQKPCLYHESLFLD